MRKAIIGIVCFVLLTTGVLGYNQEAIDGINDKIGKYRKIEKRISDFLIQYPEKNIKFYRKKIKRLRHLEMIQQAKLAGVRYLKKCIRDNEQCSFFNLNSQSSKKDINAFKQATKTKRQNYKQKIRRAKEKLAELKNKNNKKDNKKKKKK